VGLDEPSGSGSSRAKLGIVAGGGGLPVALAERCVRSGRPFHVIRLRGFADQPLDVLQGETIGIAEIGKVMASLRSNGCKAVCFAGYVKRPDLAALKPDLRGLAVLPGAIAAARNGDDALMTYLVGVFEQEGFRIEGADDVDQGLTLGAGPMGRLSPSVENEFDIARALEVARLIGSMDIGQGAVVVDGLVLAVEAQEGTDAMLQRCAALPQEVRGHATARRGVLAKCPKPMQEMRIDLPTIGVSTVEGVAAAGLAGIVGETGRMLVMDRDGVIAAADRLGVFVVGVEPPAGAG
jgi:UDP-2,3-diacylglucosamine hydrolase